jgi:flagellar hook assembly protein FlgD
LTIYDPLGRRVATLADEVRDAGMNEVVWNGQNDSGKTAAGGVYFYRLRTKDRVLTKKLLFLK